MEDLPSEHVSERFEVKIAPLDENKPGRFTHVSPRVRRRFLVLLNGLLVLVMVCILATTLSVRELVSSIFIHLAPTPTAMLFPGVDLFYVAASPSWGQLSVDGHLITLPTISVDPPLRFARGQHQLVWQATPFLTQHCMISVPPSFADTCSDHRTAQSSVGPSAWVITFSESLANLAGTDRAALLQTAQAALDARQSTDTVRSGEHYVLAADNPVCSRHDTQGYQCYASGSQPLKATLSFRLDTNKASNETCIDIQLGNCTLNYEDCRQFCAGSFPASSSAREWDVFAPVLSLWTFATMNGQILAQDVPDTSAVDYATGQNADESLVQLHITWDRSGWHVALSATLDSSNPQYQGSGYFDPVCVALTQQVETLNPPAVNGVPMDVQWHFVSGALPAAGCLALGATQPESGSTTSPPTRSLYPTIMCLHRFGVLLVVSTPAQHSGWALPLADAYEQQLAQSLLKG